MAFFDDFSKHMDKIKKGAQKTAELAKMQHQVSVKQSDFDKLFGEIGRLYYSARQRGEQPDSAMDALCDKVDALAAEISDLKKKIDDLRQVNRCPECGAEQPAANAFCSSCGAKLPEKKPEEAPAKEEAPVEDESRDVYIKWPDGSVKEEEKTETPAEAPEAAEAAQSDEAVEPEAAEEAVEAPEEEAHEETHE